VTEDFAKEMIKVAQPVLKWLVEAEEDSESEGDMAVAFDDRSRVVGTVVTEEKEKKPKEAKPVDKADKKGGAAAAGGKAKAEEEDVDIDNI
jgi:hypothetical protein